jgi:2,5-diketo-D-gluconate reductase B
MRITDPDAVTNAIDIGYRHIDTAQKYENEAEVGEGIAAADVPREDLFVATKIEESNLAPADVRNTAEASLDRLGLDAVDLLYIHWPAATSHEDRYDPDETIPVFNELLEEGLTRNVGVANFDVDLIEEAQARFEAPILADQVEMHPLLQQDELVEYAAKQDMYLIAYCPLMRGSIGEVPELDEIADKHDATPGQVSLAWLQDKDNVIPIPKSSGTHLEENHRSQELELDDDDLARIDNIDRKERVIDVEKGPWHW